MVIIPTGSQIPICENAPTVRFLVSSKFKLVDLKTVFRFPCPTPGIVNMSRILLCFSPEASRVPVLQLVASAHSLVACGLLVATRISCPIKFARRLELFLGQFHIYGEA